MLKQQALELASSAFVIHLTLCWQILSKQQWFAFESMKSFSCNFLCIFTCHWQKNDKKGSPSNSYMEFLIPSSDWCLFRLSNDDVCLLNSATSWYEEYVSLDIRHPQTVRLSITKLDRYFFLPSLFLLLWVM